MRARLTPAMAGLLVMCLMSGGCFGKDIDHVEQDLNDALSQLEQQSTSWQGTLTTLEDKLRGDGSDLVQQVGQLLDASIQVAGIESRCTVDFIGHRAHDALHNLLQIHLHKTVTPPDPHVCTTNPSGDLLLADVQSGRVTHLDIDGYDLVRDDGFTVAAANRAGQKRPIGTLFVANPSPYLITVNLSRGKRLPGALGYAEARIHVQGRIHRRHERRGRAAAAASAAATGDRFGPQHRLPHQR
jgi:hypothetical protein